LRRRQVAADQVFVDFHRRGGAAATRHCLAHAAPRRAKRPGQWRQWEARCSARIPLRPKGSSSEYLRMLVSESLQAVTPD
jgi:hypothetical protein